MPLMTQDEYAKVKHASPYVYKILKDNQVFYYFGEKHSYDKNDGQWIELRNLWNEFVKKTEGRKRIVFYEGGGVRKWDDGEEAIMKAGGTGFITYLTSGENIDILCPEPDKRHEYMELEKNFSKDEIEYYYFARIVAQWWRKSEPKPEFEEYINYFLKRDQEISGWDDFDFSLENMKKIHRKIFDTDFDLDNQNFFREVASPVGTKTIINKVCRASGDIREEHIVKKILEYWNRGYSIFVEYGSGHAVREEPLLREILGK